MIWIILIVIVFLIVLVTAVPTKKLSYSEIQKIKQDNAFAEFEIFNNLPPEDAVYYIEKLDQEIIDDIFRQTWLHYNDYLVERAFLKRYRWGKVDTEYYIELIREREMRRNKRKKK